MLPDRDMPVLNSLTGALDLDVVKVKPYREDSLPMPTEDERTLVLGHHISSCAISWLVSQLFKVLQVLIHDFLKTSNDCFHLMDRRPASPTGISRCCGSICYPNGLGSLQVDA